MKNQVVILGGGGHAKVLIDILRINKVDILNVVDPGIRASELSGIKVLKSDEQILEFSSDKILLVNGLGSTKDTTKRKEIFINFKNKGFSFYNVIHPSAVIASDVELAEGVQVMAGSIIQPGSRIGENTIVNTKVSIDHDCHIGPHVHMAPGVTLSGGIKVGKGTHIGAGATIIQGVNIGENSLIGAGAVVIKDVINGTTVIGIPAREV